MLTWESLFWIWKQLQCTDFCSMLASWHCKENWHFWNQALLILTSYSQTSRISTTKVWLADIKAANQITEIFFLKLFSWLSTLFHALVTLKNTHNFKQGVRRIINSGTETIIYSKRWCSCRQTQSE